MKMVYDYRSVSDDPHFIRSDVVDDDAIVASVQHHLAKYHKVQQKFFIYKMFLIYHSHLLFEPLKNLYRL